MLRQSFFIVALLFVHVSPNTISPLKKIIRLAFGVSKATYFPLEGGRYLQDGHINGLIKSSLSPGSDPSNEKICCSVGGWTAKAYEKKDTEIILFTHTEQKIAVFGFRGTEKTSINDWKKNFKIALAEASIGSTTFRIHEGFRDRYLDISSWFEEEYRAIPRDYTIIITGHSLGGALATISAVYASGKLHRRPDAVITFASPLVGEQDFKDYYGQMVGCDCTLRITAKGDFITKLPLSNSYTHVCSALKVDGSTGWNFLKAHSLYYGYDKGLERKFSASDINFGCDQLF